MCEYIITVPHFYCMEYIEKDKKMTIEMDFRESRFFLDKNLIKRWDAPFQEERISEDKKEEILKNIYTFLLERTDSSNIILQK